MVSFASSTRSRDRIAVRSRSLPPLSGGRRAQRGQTGPTGRELVGLSLGVAVAVIVPVFGGIAADSVLHSSPIGLLVGVLLGVLAAAATVFQRFKPYL